MSDAKKRWSELSPMSRTAIVSGAVVDVALRCWALVDLVNRPKEQVRGSKAAWAIGLGLVSSVGMLPTAYLVCGRRRT